MDNCFKYRMEVPASLYITVTGDHELYTREIVAAVQKLLNETINDQGGWNVVEIPDGIVRISRHRQQEGGPFTFHLGQMSQVLPLGGVDL